MSYLIKPYILERIIVHMRDVDLFNLMCVSSEIRSIVGKSSVWGNLLGVNGIKFDKLDRHLNVPEIYKMFLSLKLSKFNFDYREYYGNYYCLYVMKKWLGRNNYWSIYSLINNQLDIEKLFYLCGYLMEPTRVSYYNDWIEIMSGISTKLSKISHPDKDKFLKMIYIDEGYYAGTMGVCVKIISSGILYCNKILNDRYMSGIDWYMVNRQYIIGEDICLKSEHDYYTMSFYHFNLYPLSMEECNGARVIIYPEDFRSKMSKISKYINIDYKLFIDILRIVLGRCDPNVMRKVDRVFSDC